MQVTETLSDGLRRAFSVVVPAAEIEGKVRVKLAEIGRTIKLPGFRPGKVPPNLLRQRYGASIMAEVMQDALNTATDQVVEERGLRPAGQPKVALAGEPAINAKAASDLAFSVEMELLPEIAVPDLASLHLTRLRSEVAPEVVDKTLERLASQQRETRPLEEDRGAETGDVLLVDFTGTIDGVPFEGGTGQDAKVEIGGPGFIAGFSEGMQGMRAGDVRSIDVTFPAEYHADALAGKAAKFEVSAKSLGQPAEQPVDDSLATKLGFDTIDKLRETVHDQMQRELDQMSRLRIKRELLDVLAERADFPAPQNLVDAEFAAIWQRVEQDMSSGEIDEEDRGKDPDVLKAEYRAIADRRVRLGLLLSEVGRAASVQVSQAELSQALRAEAARYPGQEMQVVEFFRKTPQALEGLRGPLFEDKVVDYILEMAQVEDRLVPSDELNLPPAEAAPPKLGFEPAGDDSEALAPDTPEPEPEPEPELEAQPGLAEDAPSASEDTPVARDGDDFA